MGPCRWVRQIAPGIGGFDHQSDHHAKPRERKDGASWQGDAAARRAGCPAAKTVGGRAGTPWTPLPGGSGVACLRQDPQGGCPATDAGDSDQRSCRVPRGTGDHRARVPGPVRGRDKGHRETSESGNVSGDIARLHLIPAFGSTKLENLTREQVQKMYSEKRDAGLSAARVRRIHGVLSSALICAVRWRLIGHNVCKEVNPPAGAPAHDTALERRRSEAVSGSGSEGRVPRTVRPRHHHGREDWGVGWAVLVGR
jgi:integrase-like protein